MKQQISAVYFKDFISKIPSIKNCVLNNNDAAIELKNGNKISMHIVVAKEGYPKQILDIIANRDSSKYCVVVAPYISEQTSRKCEEACIGYVDLAGNCFISCDSLYIHIKGNKNANISKRGLKSIYEKSSIVSSIILRIMLEDVNVVWKMKDLAKAASCSIGQVAKVKDFLLKQAYIEKTSDGIKIVEPEALMRDWAETYNKNGDNITTYYSLNSTAELEAMLAQMNTDTGIEYILTGFSGGSRYQPVVRYQKLHAYIDFYDLEKVIHYLGLKKVDTGANVILIHPYNNCVKYGTKLKNGNIVASPVQLYLDCMNIKGRGEEMANAILEREICK